MRVFAVSEFSDFADVFQISAMQAKFLLGYMEGSGYGFGTANGVLFRIDVEDEKEEADEYTIKGAVEIVREWIDDFVKDIDASVCSTDDYNLTDVVTEDSFNNLVGGIFGSYSEREEKREKLLQLKLDDIELARLL